MDCLKCKAARETEGCDLRVGLPHSRARTKDRWCEDIALRFVGGPTRLGWALYLCPLPGVKLPIRGGVNEKVQNDASHPCITHVMNESEWPQKTHRLSIGGQPPVPNPMSFFEVLISLHAQSRCEQFLSVAFTPHSFHIRSFTPRVCTATTVYRYRGSAQQVEVHSMQERIRPNSTTAVR